MPRSEQSFRTAAATQRLYEARQSLKKAFLRFEQSPDDPEVQDLVTRLIERVQRIEHDKAQGSHAPNPTVRGVARMHRDDPAAPTRLAGTTRGRMVRKLRAEAATLGIDLAENASGEDIAQRVLARIVREGFGGGRSALLSAIGEEARLLLRRSIPSEDHPPLTAFIEDRSDAPIDRTSPEGLPVLGRREDRDGVWFAIR